MIYKCYLVDGQLKKIEKWNGSTKVSECGIDDENAILVFGSEQPLRAEYEQWVSQGHAPQYFNSTAEDLGL